MKLQTRFLMGMTALVLLVFTSLSPRLMTAVSAQAAALPGTDAGRNISITLTVDEDTATAGIQAIWALIPLPEWLKVFTPVVNFKPEHLACVNLVVEVPIVGQVALGHACLKAEVVDGQISISVDSVGVGGSIMLNNQRVELKNIDKAARKVKKAFKRYIKQTVKQMLVQRGFSDQALLGLTISDIYMTDTTLNIVISNES